ncbi:MAG: magnesium transporter, partial [Nitrospiraceae bacterium]
ATGSEMTTAAELMTVDIPRGERDLTVGDMASLLPLGLARLGADPALASGPVATAVQDILSVGSYPMIATALIPA